MIGTVLASRAIRLALWLLAHLFFKIRIIGADRIPAQGGALLVSNHVSYADAILIGCATPRFIRFLIWQPLYEIKWLNPFCRLLFAIPLPTGSPKETLRALGRARRELDQGRLVCIFPEGEMARTPHMKPFERGVEVITRGLESAPVIPVFLDGLWGHALSRKGGRVFASRLKLRHKVTVSIGQPVFSDSKPDNLDAEHLYQRVYELGAQTKASALPS